MLHSCPGAGCSCLPRWLRRCGVVYAARPRPLLIPNDPHIDIPALIIVANLHTYCIWNLRVATINASSLTCARSRIPRGPAGSVRNVVFPCRKRHHRRSTGSETMKDSRRISYGFDIDESTTPRYLHEIAQALWRKVSPDETEARCARAF